MSEDWQQERPSAEREALAHEPHSAMVYELRKDVAQLLPTPQLAGALMAALAQLSSKLTQGIQVTLFKKSLSDLASRMAAVEARVPKPEMQCPVIVPVETFVPEPYELLRPFHVVVQPYEDEYLATFFDASIGATGDTQEEAVANLKELILALYVRLSDLDEPQLGPEPCRQRRILQSLIRKV